jgi:hypothetical protein
VLYLGKLGQGGGAVAPSYVTHRFSWKVFAPGGAASRMSTPTGVPKVTDS